MFNCVNNIHVWIQEFLLYLDDEHCNIFLLQAGWPVGGSVAVKAVWLLCSHNLKFYQVFLNGAFSPHLL